MIEHTCINTNLTKYQHIAETVSCYACRYKTRWLKHNLSYTHSKLSRARNKKFQIKGSWHFHTWCKVMIEHTQMQINPTKYQDIADTVTVSAFRSETRWLKHNLSYTHSKLSRACKKKSQLKGSRQFHTCCDTENQRLTVFVTFKSEGDTWKQLDLYLKTYKFGLRDVHLLLRLLRLCLRCVSEAFLQLLYERCILSVVFIVGATPTCDPLRPRARRMRRVRNSYTFSHIA